MELAVTNAVDVLKNDTITNNIDTLVVVDKQISAMTL